MKARIKGTNTIVECTDTGTLINENKGIECRHSNGAIEVIPGDCLIEIEEAFDWQSFRAEAAKDILSAIIASPSIIKLKDDKGNLIDFCKEDACEISIEYADELVKQLKEKEGK